MAGRTTSARALTHVVLDDFSGGISAARDKVAMRRNETPMSRNIEWYRTGGFFGRKGVGALVHGAVGQEVEPLGSATNAGAVGTNTPTVFYHYIRDPGVASTFISQYLVATANGRVFVCADFGTLPTGAATLGEWYAMLLAGVPITTVGPPTFAGWDTKVYMSLGVQAITGSGKAMYRYGGNTLTTIAMGKAFNDNYANPLGMNMPAARYCQAWAERMWLAVPVSDAGVVQGSRVMWSHPGQPEDWATLDYVDVGQQGDTITGIAPMRDMLVIFKNSATYAMLGSGSTNFRVVEISGTIGCTGQWTRDDQGSIVFWDAAIGACRFDGTKITHLFAPLLPFIQDRVVTTCLGLATDGERLFVATDFSDYLGDRVTDPAIGDIAGTYPAPAAPVPTGINPVGTLWSVIDDMTWEALSAFRWQRTGAGSGTVSWIHREDAGWTTFTLDHPSKYPMVMLGQIRNRVGATGDLETNRRVVVGLGSELTPLVMQDRFDDGFDHFRADLKVPIDAFYLSPWLHGGLPAQVKRWKAPRIIQEADAAGVLLVDVFYDFNHTNLRRTLRIDLALPLSFDSYSVAKPGTIGRAKAVQLVFRPEHPRHWGVSSITIPLHPKVLR